MRNPVRSETDAFSIAYGGAGLAGGSLALGALVDPLAGVALLVGAVVGAVLWVVASKDPERRRPLREAASEGPHSAPEARPRVLVVANRTLQAEELRAQLRLRAAGGAEFHLVALILPSRAHYIASDVDSELATAGERLADALAWADAEGLDVSGKVGDPNASLDTIEDELRLFGPEEVIISTHPRGMSNWLEAGIVERLREELEIPVTHVVSSVADDRRAVSSRVEG